MFRVLLCVLGITLIGSLLSAQAKDESRSPVNPVSQQPDQGFKRCFLLTVFDPNDRSVNLRQTPNGKVIMAVPNGTYVFYHTPSSNPEDLASMEPAGIDPAWTPVRVNQTAGYMASKFLHRPIQKASDPKDTFVNLRNAPNGTPIKRIPNDTLVEWLGGKDKWAKIKLNSGETGYVFAGLLTDPSCF